MIPDAPGFRADRRLLVRTVLVVVALLAPLKLGTVAVTGEVGMFPLSGWEWLFATWPPFLAPVLGGFSLVLAASLFPPPRLPGKLWLIPGAWLALALSTLAGLIRTTEWDAATLLLWHFLGIAAFALAVFWVWAQDPGVRPWLIGAVVAGTLLSALGGWNQVKGGGFAETIEFVQRTAAESGQAPTPEFLNRLYQKRAFGPFVYPNSFAAHLILTGPLVLFALWRAGGCFRPEHLSRLLFLALGAVLIGGGLWFSGSRAAILALGGGTALAVLWQPLGWRWRGLLLGAGALLVAVSLWVVNEGRALESIGARFDYYRAAVQMFRAEPVTGVGLGEFFPQYMRLKPPGAEETRLSHNMLLGLAAQCGIAGGLAALLCLVLPLSLNWLAGTGAGAQQSMGVRMTVPDRLKPGHQPVGVHASACPILTPLGQPTDRLLLGCVQAGLAAWSLHALADFNCEIPGTVMLVAILPLLALAPPAASAAAASARPYGPGLAVRVGALSLGLLAMAAIARWPGEQAYQRLTDLASAQGTSLDSLHSATVRAARLLPWSPYPWSLLGRCADQVGASGLALGCYEKASDRAPHRSGFYARAAASALATGDLDKARQALAAAAAWYPHSPEVRALAAKLGPPPPP